MDGRAFNHPLRIAFVHQPWSVIRPPMTDTDSVALVTEQFARRLAARADTQVICYCRQGRGQPRVEHHAGVEYRRASVSIDRWIKLGMQTLDRWSWRDAGRPFFSSPLCYRQFIGQVIDDLAHQGCDVVHVHNFTQFVPLIRAALPEVRIVLQMHCEWLNQLDAGMIEHRLRHADAILGVSEFLARKMRRRFPHLAERISHVHNGADIGSMSRDRGALPLPNRKRVLFVGRLSPEKGVHVLLDAFQLVLREHPDAELRLIGPESVVPCEMILPLCHDPKIAALQPHYRSGAYGRWLRKRIAQFPADSVAFMHFGLSHAELAGQYQAATVFVAPSIWEEPFGMPLVEAMAAGTASIATRGGAFPEIVEDGRSGLLVERGDPEELAQAILELLEDPSRRAQLARAGQFRARSRFTWDHATRALLAHYRRVMQRYPVPQAAEWAMGN
jgi:glycosyltransferase involved in cell wall biosynthesis